MNSKPPRPPCPLDLFLQVPLLLALFFPAALRADPGGVSLLGMGDAEVGPGEPGAAGAGGGPGGHLEVGGMSAGPMEEWWAARQEVSEVCGVSLEGLDPDDRARKLALCDGVALIAEARRVASEMPPKPYTGERNSPMWRALRNQYVADDVGFLEPAADDLEVLLEDLRVSSDPSVEGGIGDSLGRLVGRLTDPSPPRFTYRAWSAYQEYRKRASRAYVDLARLVPLHAGMNPTPELRRGYAERADRSLASVLPPEEGVGVRPYVILECNYVSHTAAAFWFSMHAARVLDEYGRVAWGEDWTGRRDAFEVEPTGRDHFLVPAPALWEVAANGLSLEFPRAD